jgi:hypothetical protein
MAYLFMHGKDGLNLRKDLAPFLLILDHLGDTAHRMDFKITDSLPSKALNKDSVNTGSRQPLEALP